MAGHFGRAAFDAVGPLLLVGWSEVGPGLLQAVVATSPGPVAREPERLAGVGPENWAPRSPSRPNEGIPPHGVQTVVGERPPEVLLAQARREDTAHRAVHQKPMSADMLRVRLRVGTTSARHLVKSEFDERAAAYQHGGETVGEA
jgi:hypothetical protein